MNTNKLNKSIKFGIPHSPFIEKIFSTRDLSLKNIEYFTAYKMTFLGNNSEFILPIFSFNQILYFIGLITTNDMWYASFESFYIGSYNINEISLEKSEFDNNLFYNLDIPLKDFEHSLYDQITQNEDLIKYLITSK